MVQDFPGRHLERQFLIDEHLRAATAALEAALVAPQRSVKARQMSKALAELAMAKKIQNEIEILEQKK
ncbi:hypothetical protein RQ831_13485 [Roseomonas gilardii]|uniref:Uncharacterized protein n=1 Tax=Roseomonas gilardii TaxID=257708 RepID=A0ABU3MH86_9PROT|nr:hypothetical protein [Roseomonas gilardii]MDT8332070.1 hypothetical protein [Roseomonas gilardii]